jgi:thioredoxin reductase (NADPH)
LPLETSVPGIFAVGDVRANSVKRVASAVGDGSVSIRLVHEYLAEVRPRATVILTKSDAKKNPTRSA